MLQHPDLGQRFGEPGISGLTPRSYGSCLRRVFAVCSIWRDLTGTDFVKQESSEFHFFLASISMNQIGLSYSSKCLRITTRPLSILSQFRTFEWDPRLSRKDGKPAITGTKSAFVASHIPVVLIEDVSGLGRKGEIVEVKRGFARNKLVPEGLAVYGTLWENIDAFADPELSTGKVAEKEKSKTTLIVPFNWINSVRLNFVCDTASSTTGKLIKPLLVGDLLVALSSHEHIDFLPSQLTLPGDGITTVGCHEVSVRLELTNGTFTYCMKVDVKDKAELAAAERREAELREAMKLKRPDFVLGSSRFSETAGKLDQVDSEADFSSGEESDDENEEK